MKKPIRFNLQFQNGEGSVQIRNLDDLEENLNINDLLDSFLSGDLERWLRQRNEQERADAVARLVPNDEKETLLNLFEALNLGFPESDIADIVGRYTHQKAMAQARQMISGTEEGALESEVVISNDSPQIRTFNESRFEEYKQLKEKIKSLQSLKLSAYKPLIDVLTNDYPDYFEIDCVNFYYEMYLAKSPLPILTLLMNPKWIDLFVNLCFPPSSSSYERGKAGAKAASLIAIGAAVATQTSSYTSRWDRGDNRSKHILARKREGIMIPLTVGCPPFLTTGYTRPEAYLMFWGGGKTETYDGDGDEIDDRDETDDRDTRYSYSCLLDDANELRDNPDRPVKWIDNNDNFVSNEWKRLVPKGKKVMVFHRGANLEIEYDSNAEDDPFTYGMKCRRSGWRNRHADNVLIFMPFD